MTELRSCPFCGGYAIVRWKRGYHSARINREPSARVLCANADCNVNAYAFGPTEADAIAAWNTRADTRRKE